MKTTIKFMTMILTLSMHSHLSAQVSGMTDTLGNPYMVVGNAGNAANGSGQGSVGYNYQVMKHEVALDSYLNMVNDVYNQGNSVDGSGGNINDYHLINSHINASSNPSFGALASVVDNGAGAPIRYTAENATEALRPINFTSSQNYLRYANYLTQKQYGLAIDVNNGYSVIDTTGKYGPMIAGNSHFVTGLDGTNSSYNGGQYFRLPTADEFVKAAYYQGSGNTYNNYAFDIANAGGANIINHVKTASNGPADANLHTPSVTDGFPISVAGYPNAFSHYGILNGTGNVSEAIDPGNVTGTPSFDYYGGDWFNTGNTTLSYNSQSDHRGMRLVHVPEPSSSILLGLGMLGLLVRRTR